MGHKQMAPTPIKTDNSTATGFVNNNMQMKKSKTWDMHLHWLRDKEKQNFFNVFWDKGSNQGADYFTKHHPTIHHRRIRDSFQYIRDVHDAVQNKVNALF